MAIDKFLVEASHIMMFARSVGDANPIYHDEDYAKKTELGGIIAPPTFAQSSAQFDPDYFLRPKIGGKAGLVQVKKQLVRNHLKNQVVAVVEPLWAFMQNNILNTTYP